MKNFTRGIIHENPIFILMLGLCPTLAVTTSFFNGLGMGVATLVVLFCSNAVISLIRDIVPEKIRIPVFIVVIASFVTVVDLLLQGFVPDLAKELGIFIPLIVVNCVILGRAEAFASRHSLVPSMFDGLGMAVGFTLALILLASIREIFGKGTLTLFVLKKENINIVINFSVLKANKAVVMILPPGAFLTLGLLMGFFNARKKQPSIDTNRYTLRDNHIARRGFMRVAKLK